LGVGGRLAQPAARGGVSAGAVTGLEIVDSATKDCSALRPDGGGRFLPFVYRPRFGSSRTVMRRLARGSRAIFWELRFRKQSWERMAVVPHCFSVRGHFPPSPPPACGPKALVFAGAFLFHGLAAQMPRSGEGSFWWLPLPAARGVRTPAGKVCRTPAGAVEWPTRGSVGRARQHTACRPRLSCDNRKYCYGRAPAMNGHGLKLATGPSCCWATGQT
jgi:hypothetical protein